MKTLPLHSFDLTPHWHLASELLALTVLKLFPNVQLVGGGVNSLGFFYDFIFQQPLSEGMLELIEVDMHRFIKEGHDLRFLSMMRENAQSLFEHHGLERLAEKAGHEECNIVEILQIGDFYGLCPALAFATTEEAGYVKILECAGLPQENPLDEWRVTRITGTSQLHSKELKSFLKTYDQFLKKRDHRHLGPKLNLFSFSKEGDPLGIVWHSKGIRLRRFLQDWLVKQLPQPPHEISTPAAVRQDFHPATPNQLEPFRFEGSDYVLRSSPLRQHLHYFRNYPFGSEEFPWQINEYAEVYHDIPDYQRWGLFSACSHLSDQTTICSEKKQVIPELISSLQFIEQIITIFGFTARWVLIASRQKTPKARQESEAIGWLRIAFQESNSRFPLSPDLLEEDEGETPRLELRIHDAIGRQWPASAIRIVIPLQEGDSVRFTDRKEASSLVVWTRQIWGSLDRFIALLIERFEGEFPLWLAPEQVRVFAIGEANNAYAAQICTRFEQKGLRAGLDVRQSKLAVRIHEAETENIPYLVLVGEQERAKEKISVRAADKFKQNLTIDLESFLNKIDQEFLSPQRP